MENKIKLCVSTVCIDFEEKKFLVVFEKQDGKEVMNLPSGHVEFGEDPEEAAVRELFEETKTTADILVFGGITNLIEGTTNYFTMVYGCIGRAREACSDMADEDVYRAEWLTFDEIVKLRPMHRNGFVEEKIRMCTSAIQANLKPIKSTVHPSNHFHRPWFRKEVY